MSAVEMDIKISVEVRGKFTPGTEDSYNGEHGNWLPGDPPDAEDIKVVLYGADGYGLEISKWLSKDQLDEIKNEFIKANEGDDI